MTPTVEKQASTSTGNYLRERGGGRGRGATFVNNRRPRFVGQLLNYVNACCWGLDHIHVFGCCVQVNALLHVYKKRYLAR